MTGRAVAAGDTDVTPSPSPRPELARRLPVPGVWGYVDRIGVAPGGSVRFHVSAPAAYELTVVRLGRTALLDAPTDDAADRAEAERLATFQHEAATPQSLSAGSYVHAEGPAGPGRATHDGDVAPPLEAAGDRRHPVVLVRAHRGPRLSRGLALRPPRRPCRAGLRVRGGRRHVPPRRASPQHGCPARTPRSMGAPRGIDRARHAGPDRGLSRRRPDHQRRGRRAGERARARLSLSRGCDRRAGGGGGLPRRRHLAAVHRGIGTGTGCDRARRRRSGTLAARRTGPRPAARRLGSQRGARPHRRRLVRQRAPRHDRPGRHLAGRRTRVRRLQGRAGLRPARRPRSRPRAPALERRRRGSSSGP